MVFTFDHFEVFIVSISEMYCHKSEELLKSVENMGHFTTTTINITTVTSNNNNRLLQNN